MAVDRQRLAGALAYEEQKRRMMESVPTVGNLPPAQPARRSLRTDLENLSSGLGRGIVNQLEGVKGLVTDPVGTVKGAYEGVKGIVRDPSVLADALRYTADKAMSGPLGAGEVIGEMVSPMRGKPPMAEIDVYHGSPHVFDEFDASKIGTGEGAQAFGHGIYLAESPDIAKHYQKQLGKFYDQVQTPEGMMPLEEAVTKYHPDGAIAAKVLTKYRSKTDVDSFNKLIDDQIVPEMRAQYPQSEWEKFKPQQGNLYTADLPDEMVDRMLDWDKPLSEQPEAVRKALKDAYNADWLGDESKQTGQDLYKRMGRMHGDDIAAVSRDLRDIGIPGIRYLDAGSRGQGGSGTRNFVVFPGEEKKVKILKRE